MLVPSGFSWRIVAHELGHAFDLEHDFRDSEYIMSYGGGNQARLSACAAEYLTVHPYFNPGIRVAQGASPSTIDPISPPGYSAGSTSIPIRLNIGNSSGLHQVLLFATTELPHFAAGGAEIKECRSFSGERTAVVEFDYDGVIPSKANSSLADPIVHRMRFWAVDTSGRVSHDSFTLHQLSDRHIATLEEPRGLTALAFSPDGTTLAAASWAEESPVKLWDVGTREIIASFGSASPGLAVAISPDGATLASEHNGTVKVWEVATATRTATLEGRPGDPRFSAVAFSPPDGATLAVLSGQRTVELWGLATEANYADLDHDSEVTSLAFSPDGTSLATATTDGMVILWDPATGERTAVVGGHASWVGAVTFSPDGATLASQAGWDGLVKLWDVKTQRTVATIENVRGGSAMAFSPDGATLACASGELVKLWDVGTRVQIDSLAHRATVKVVAFSPDGETLATGTWKGVELWDVSEWTKYPPHSLVKTSDDEQQESEQETTTDGQSTPQTSATVSGDGQEGPASTQLDEPLVVLVVDQDGSPLAGVNVTFAVTAGGGRLSAATDANPCIFKSSKSSITATTDANGQAATRLTLGSEPGTNTVEATVEGLESVTFTATAAEQAAPHRLTKVCGDDQEGIAGEQLVEPLVVSVVDEDGAAIAGVDVSFAVNAGGGRLSSATATTNANGRARTWLTLGSEPGTNTVSATVEGLESVIFTATGQESPLADFFDSFLGGGKLVALPDRTQLAQNAPNPFNSQTILSYFLHAPGPARIEVFALSGQRVAVLQQGPQQAGYHRLRWDGRDDAGRPVASGAYLYRLMTDETVLTRKLILLR